jgi:TfoX/Sxy family transcriptional regulator of competence genes
MAYSEDLAQRTRDAIGGRPGVRERKMFGGVAWMVNGNMAVGVIGEDLMVRLERAEAEQAMAEEHVGPMEFTGRPLGGFILVDSAGIGEDIELGR